MKARTLYRYKDFLPEQTEEAQDLVNQVTANALWNIIDEDGDFAIYPLYDTRTGKAIDEERVSAMGRFLTHLDINFTFFEVGSSKGTYPDERRTVQQFLFVRDVVEGQAQTIAERFKLDRIVVGNRQNAFTIDLVGSRERISLNKGDMRMAWAGFLLGLGIS
ncbi:MAG: hypothetical protein JST83_05320 [Bacteroidetes bacterium]|nr:hypothetical protein [Bacteroidota bacterium]